MMREESYVCNVFVKHEPVFLSSSGHNQQLLFCSQNRLFKIIRYPVLAHLSQRLTGEL